MTVLGAKFQKISRVVRQYQQTTKTKSISNL